MKKYVWYASYGSNISTNRFMCYIKGGTAIGALTSEEGCRDNSDPLRYENITINRQQYYKKEARRWQEKGVAFIDLEVSNVSTLGRMYLITIEQFEDVVKQENAMRVSDVLDIKLEDAVLNGDAYINESWYGQIAHLGYRDNYPIFTFTNPDGLDFEPLNGPSEPYLLMIGRGLVEHYKIEVDELADYFYNKPGVSLRYDKFKLTTILQAVYEEEAI